MAIGQLVRALLDEAAIVVTMGAPLDGPRLPPPVRGNTMISVITRGGIYLGAGPIEAITADPRGGPVIAAATELLQVLIGRSAPARADRRRVTPSRGARRAGVRRPGGAQSADASRPAVGFASSVPVEAPVTETLDRVKTYQQFIGGQWVDAASGETLAVENPADGTVVAHVPASGQVDVDRAVDAAETAFETWSLTTPQPAAWRCSRSPTSSTRTRTSSAGSSPARRASRSAPPSTRCPSSSDLFRFFAGACRVMEGLAVTEYLDGHTSMVRRDPVGVVASIAPWNYPLYMAAWKLGPALATGNTVVLKPSARTPLSALGSRSSSPTSCRRACSTCCRARAARWATCSSRTPRSGWSRSPATP